MQSREIQKVRIIGPRSVSKRGGSLQVTLPRPIRDHLGIDTGTQILFIIDEESRVILAKSDRMEITLSNVGKPATLGFTVPRRLARKFLKGEKKHAR